jgi:NAD dependent epimerase/dehydratase family enzyme
MALGEMAQIVLSSQRVVPRALEQAGYLFRYLTLADALAALYL